MSTSSALPVGAFFTTINGKKCTAIPRSTASSSSTAAKNTNAVSAAAADTSVSTSTTSSSLVTVTSTSSSSTSTLSSTSIAQPTEVLTPVLVPNPAVVQEPPLAALSPVAATTATNDSSNNIPPAVAPSQTSPSQVAQQPVIGSSQTDSSTIASAAVGVAAASQQQGAVAPEATSAPALSDVPAAAPLFTTIGTAAPSSDSAAAAAAATDTNGSTNSAVSSVPNSSGNAVQSTVAVAGGVIGGVVAISLIAFVVWWWRRRVMRRRRSTLLTPLTTDEKEAYVINRGSIGPTPMTERIRATFDYNVKRIRGRMSHLVTKSTSSSPAVNMNRGNSQFMEPVSTHSRASSATTGIGATETTKDRFKDWLSRIGGGMRFNWRLRSNRFESTEPFSSMRGMQQKKSVPLGAQPDFLTLLSMDEGELDREAQRRRNSRSGRNGSADNFLGGLNLNFGGGEDPFSDDNALAHRSAKPGPLIVSQPNNPFSDDNAIRNPAPTVPKPTTYVADIRRSRAPSTSGNRAPSTVYRDSAATVESFGARRNKFRSDPFDLERPELLLAGARDAKNSITSSTAGTAGGSEPRHSRLSGGVGTGTIRKPTGAHTRSESFSSKYSSGVSMGDWSDPGPDVGPGSGPGSGTRWEGPEPRESPTQGWRDRQERDASQHGRGGRRQSGGSQGSVGKAM